jgi:hypothetical protein
VKTGTPVATPDPIGDVGDKAGQQAVSNIIGDK